MNEGSEINTVADVERPADIIFPNDPSLADGSNIDRSDAENIRLLRKSLVYVLEEKGITLNRAQYRILRTLSESYFFDAADRRNIGIFLDYLDKVKNITNYFIELERSFPSNLIQIIENYQANTAQIEGVVQKSEFMDRLRYVNEKCREMRKAYRPRRGAPENKSVLRLVEKAIKIYEIGSNSRFSKTLSKANNGRSNASINPKVPEIYKIVQAIDPTISEAQIDTALRKLPPSRFEPVSQ